MAKNTNWKKESHKIQLADGFTPPSKMKAVIDAFNQSGQIIIQDDLSNPITMPSKTLFLVGGSVREFLLGKTLKDFHLATDATPSQIGIILAANGFHFGGDRSKDSGSELDLPKFIKIDGDDKPIKTLTPNGLSRQHRYWYINKRDSSPEKKAYSIVAVVDHEKFAIDTLRKESESSYDFADVEFTDDIREDAKGRDFTINALYLELNKSDNENKILYDPTGRGLSDLKQGTVKMIGDAKKKVGSDPIKALRAVRFHSKIGKGDLDKEILSIMPKIGHLKEKFNNPDYITDEIDKGLSSSDIDPRKYLKALLSTGMLSDIFSSSSLADPEEAHDVLPMRSKPLAFAYLFRKAPYQEAVAAVEPYVTGKWSKDLQRSIQFLLSLREYSPARFEEFKHLKERCSIRNNQILDWIDLFKVDGMDTNPRWAESIREFVKLS